MAPSRRATTTTTSASASATDPARRIMTRSIYKKQQQQHQQKKKKLKTQSLEKGEEEEVSSTTEASTNSMTFLSRGDANKEGCSTPKGDKYKIPKISTCPPAPKKKKRLVLNCMPSSAPSSSAKFFSHSDLEVFFLFSPRNIHA